MGKRILTNSIVDPSTKQPFTGKDLNFVQDNTEDLLGSVIKNIIGPVYSTQSYLIYGSVNTGTHPDVNISSGYIYLNDVLYNSDSFTCSLTGGNVVVGYTHSIFDINIDPVYFSNGLSYSIHQISKITWEQGVTGSQPISYNSLIKVGNVVDYLDMNGVRSQVSIGKKIIEIGTWNMESTSYVDVYTGISDITKVISCNVIIIPDNPATQSSAPLSSLSLDSDLTGGVLLGTPGSAGIHSNYVTIARVATEGWDGTGFNGSGNRGYVYLEYMY